MHFDKEWRERIAKRCGGAHFDAPGKGYAFSAVLAEERELAKSNQAHDPGSALLTLSVADPTWKMHDDAMTAALKYFDNCPDATRYTDNAGVQVCPAGGIYHSTHVQLAACLNSRYTEKQVQFTSEWVQYSPGSIKRALAEFVPSLLFDAETKLIFPTPGYPVIKSPMNNRQAKVRDIPMLFMGDQWKINLSDKMMKSISDLDVLANKVMYVNMPHNPTGSGYTNKDWQELLEWARKRNVVLVVDEAYIDLCYRKDIVSVLTIPGWEECCIVLQSVSKGWNATGLRFGWMVAHPTVIQALRKITDVKDSGMFGPSIAAGLKCLHHPEWAEETRRRYQHLHQLLSQGLLKAGFLASMPDAGLCQLTPAPRTANGSRLAKFADAAECARWFRQYLRISLMHYTVNDKPWLRWAVTLKPVPECGLPDEGSVISEVVRRLQGVNFSF